jgi:hypothetical protein
VRAFFVCVRRSWDSRAAAAAVAGCADLSSVASLPGGILWRQAISSGLARFFHARGGNAELSGSVALYCAAQQELTPFSILREVFTAAFPAAALFRPPYSRQPALSIIYRALRPIQSVTNA